MRDGPSYAIVLLMPLRRDRQAPLSSEYDAHALISRRLWIAAGVAIVLHAALLIFTPAVAPPRPKEIITMEVVRRTPPPPPPAPEPPQPAQPEAREERANEPESGDRGFAQRNHHECDAQAHRDDADIFDGMIGEQAFEIVIDDRIKDTDQRAGRADARDHDSPEQLRRPGQLQDDERKPVHRDLQHRAREHGRRVCRRDGMRPRQPKVQWNETRFRAEPGEGQGESGIANTARQISRVRRDRSKRA